MDVIEKGAFQAVGILVEAQWQDLWRVMPEAWRELQARHGEIDGRVDDRLMDISLVHEGGVYRQLVGAEVGSAVNAPEGMSPIAIPAGRYIYHRHIGPVDAIAGAFGAMYDWAKAQGLHAESFKIDTGYKSDGYGEDHELYVRLQPE